MFDEIARHCVGVSHLETWVSWMTMLSIAIDPSSA
jgi:hypothetical protein